MNVLLVAHPYQLKNYQNRLFRPNDRKLLFHVHHSFDNNLCLDLYIVESCYSMNSLHVFHQM